MMGIKEKVPDLFKPVVGWQISVSKEELHQALEHKLRDLQIELEELSGHIRRSNNWSGIERGIIARNPRELAERMHEHGFRGHRESELRADIDKCKRRLSENGTQINQRDMEWLGSYLDVPSILRRAADQLDYYYRK